MSGNRSQAPYPRLFARFTARWAAVLSLAAVAGCATRACPPFQAGWYLLEKSQPKVAATSGGQQQADTAARADPGDSMPTVYLVLLNEGSQPAALHRVIVNPVAQGRGRAVIALEPADHGWQPGELRLVQVDAELGACILPITVQIECGGTCHSRPQAVVGALPNYLHDAWLTRCQAMKAKAS